MAFSITVEFIGGRNRNSQEKTTEIIRITDKLHPVHVNNGRNRKPETYVVIAIGRCKYETLQRRFELLKFIGNYISAISCTPRSSLVSDTV